MVRRRNVIDFPALIAKFQLQNLLTRIQEHETARNWAMGRWDGLDKSRDALMPRPIDQAGRDAWDRLMRQLQSAGPRALSARLDAAIGSVTWGGDDPQNIDSRLAALDLDALAERLAVDVCVTGIAAVIASQAVEGGEPKLTRLSGYLEPITAPENVDELAGLYQTWQTMKRGKLVYTVRVYDFEALEMREWSSLSSPMQLGKNPDVIIANASMPRVLVPRMDDGLVLGEFVTALPRLKALYATEFRLLRVEEIAAFPRLFLRGEVKVENPGSPASIMRGASDGSDAKFLEPGNMEQLRDQRQSRREDLRDELSLPGGFAGNDTPSGEALRELNTRYYQSARKLAQNISRLLSQVIQDFAVLSDMPADQAPPVQISPNYEFMRELISSTVLAEFQSGLLPLAVACRELQVFHPTWTDEELEAFVASKSANAPPVTPPITPPATP
jgi:hypothetical protein